MRLLIALLLLMTPGFARASDAVALSSTVFVERFVTDAKGKTKVVLEAPKIVVPGDRLVFMLHYVNKSNATTSNFIVTNPLPEAVQYQGAPAEWAQVSVDGGKSWGQLATLRMRERDGSIRFARAEDVTHVRWAVKDKVPVGARGTLSFRGIVR
jgi:uncharacterized repeat protein (TIGR01451 family)